MRPEDILTPSEQDDLSPLDTVEAEAPTDQPSQADVPADDALPEVVPEYKPELSYLSRMYRTWFLDYASYVILERAVPHIDDGLKPVQRRILHNMRVLDNGKLIKVQNIAGTTMKYHPHGDASINDALVQLGQKGYLIDTQGNWGISLRGTRQLLVDISRRSYRHLLWNRYLASASRSGRKPMTVRRRSPLPCQYASRSCLLRAQRGLP